MAAAPASRRSTTARKSTQRTADLAKLLVDLERLRNAGYIAEQPGGRLTLTPAGAAALSRGRS